MTLDINTIGREVFARFINNGFTMLGNNTVSNTGTLALNSTSTFAITRSSVARFRIVGSAAGTISSVEIDATTAVVFPRQSTTALAPAAVLGGIYFDTTLNKLRIGGAGPAWETVTSVA